MLAGVTCGHSLSASIELAAELLRSRLGHEEMLHAVQAALTLGPPGTGRRWRWWRRWAGAGAPRGRWR